MKTEYHLTDRTQLDELLLILRQAVEEGPHNITIAKSTTGRTLKQNAALHKWCEVIASQMNDAGISQRELVGRFKAGFELPVTSHMVKDIFREVAKAMYKKESTADLSTVEVQEVYKIVDQRLGEITGVRAEWPSLDNLSAVGKKK